MFSIYTEQVASTYKNYKLSVWKNDKSNFVPSTKIISSTEYNLEEKDAAWALEKGKIQKKKKKKGFAMKANSI